ncbi:MAG: TlpA family protein disulfide reductase, partial [Fimbriimonadaceae bacterium]|nr:TlpA family protein disulfide reductase [Fimbriimonadaceae bacterium]
MKKSSFLRNLMGLGTALAASLAMAQSGTPAKVTALEPGMKAPELRVSQWFKGQEVKSFKKGQVYVVEFWATWCGPCRVSIPHLTKLAKQHGDKVHMIGVSVWERGDNIPKL